MISVHPLLTMDPAQLQKIVNMLDSAARYNLADPNQLMKVKKILDVANKLKTMPNMPSVLNAALMRFFDGPGARPEVSGIKTTVQGNKWERAHPLPLPFHRK